MAVRTYGRIAHCCSDGKTFWSISEAEPHISIRLKQFFPSIPKASVPPYTIPDTIIAAADLEWFMQRYPLEIDPDDLRHLKSSRKKFTKRQADLERILTPKYRHSGKIALKKGQQLRPYQWQAIDVMRKRRRLLLGDEGGLGKTYTAAGFLVSEPQSLPAAVVCDSHMQQQWKDKVEEFTHLTVHLIKKASPYDLPKADLYIFRISQVSGWSNIFETDYFRSVVYDEPQSLRTGSGTNKGTACKILSQHTDYHLGLTATPIYNYGDEMFHIMAFIDDTALGDWKDFEREWCVPVGNGKYRINNPKALGSYLREQYAMIRRLKGDVGQQLPKVSRIVEHISYDEKTVASVEEMAHALAIKATSGTFIERGSAARELDVMLRLTTGVAKAVQVAAFTKMMIDAGEPVVLWGWHRDVYEIWLTALSEYQPALYTGSESATQKEESKRRFINGETPLLIMSLRSGAGVDGLQHRCCTGIFGELDWSPGIHQQCIWRLDREGQKNPVTAFYLVTDDGSDPPMMDVLGIKASEARSIVDPDIGIESKESDTTNLRKLVDRYLQRKKE